MKSNFPFFLRHCKFIEMLLQTSQLVHIFYSQVCNVVICKESYDGDIGRSFSSWFGLWHLASCCQKVCNPCFFCVSINFMFTFMQNSNMTSFFHFVNTRAIYRLGIISLAHAPVHVTDFPVVNVHVDELSSARIWQHKLCATFSASVIFFTVFQSKYTTL